jgi:predicted transcriptional regulator
MTVGTAARTEFGVLAPHDSVERVAEMAVRRAQSDFPVLLNGQVIGLLTRGDLARWLADDGAERTAADVMHRTFGVVDASEPLDAVFTRLSQESGQTLLVMDQARLVGLVGLEEITNWLRVKRAVAGYRTAGRDRAA